MSTERATRVLAWAAAPALLTVAATLLVTALTDVRTNQLVNDPAALHDFPVYVGVFSHLGVGLWVASATIGLFAWGVLRRDGRPAARFFRATGLLSAALAIDDLLLLHERVAPSVLGVSEVTVFAVEGAAALAIGVRHAGFMFADGRGLLVLAGVAFAASVGMDLWDPSGLDVLVEDALKMLGIGVWLSFLATRAAGAVRPAARARPVSVAGPQSPVRLRLLDAGRLRARGSALPSTRSAVPRSPSPPDGR